MLHHRKVRPFAAVELFRTLLTTAIAESRPRALPQTQYLSITTGNLPAIRKKLLELNGAASSDVTLSDTEVKSLEALFKQLQSSSTLR